MNHKYMMYGGIAATALGAYNVLFSSSAYGPFVKAPYSPGKTVSGFTVLTSGSDSVVSDLQSAGMTFWLVQAALIVGGIYLYHKG